MILDGGIDRAMTRFNHRGDDGESRDIDPRPSSGQVEFSGESARIGRCTPCSFPRGRSCSIHKEVSLRQYETGFVLSPTLSEEETAQFVQQMAEIVAQKKGRMVKQDVWGKRRLAFPIKRFQEGVYVFFTYEGGGRRLRGAGAPVQADRRRHPVHDGPQGPAGPRPRRKKEEARRGSRPGRRTGRGRRRAAPAEVKEEK